MKCKYSFLMITLSISVMLFVSCSKKTAQVTPSPTTPTTPVTPATPAILKKYFVSIIKSQTETKDQLIAQLPIDFPPEASFLLPKISVQAVSIKYKTKDAHGNAVEASGLITYPSSGSIKGVIVGQHYTLSSNANVPTSLMSSAESLFSLFGYAVVSADYIGYGTTKDLVHPYMHYESTGLATVDMLFASREYFDSMKLTLPKTPINVVGYSEGGYAAMAFEKMAETNYANDITIGKVFAGGGPYDLSATYQAVSGFDTTSLPATLPLLVLGLNDADNLHLDFFQVFKEPLLTKYPNWILPKQLEIYDIDDSIGTNHIRNFMADQVFDVNNDNTKKLLASFAKNSLIDGWTPKAKVFLTQAQEDDVVPPINATNAYNAFKARGVDIILTTPKGGHLDAIVDFYIGALSFITQ